ncbi:MAG: hypothetical protein ACYS0G_07855 [Planctomycetota bacterium]|jgi:hypothetical protein
MDAHRLRSVIDLIIDEHGRLEIEKKFARILETLDACISNPSPVGDVNFRTALESLVSALKGSRTNDFVESSRRILRSMEGERFTGDGLAERIQAIANVHPFLAAQAKDELAKVADGVQAYLGTLSSARANLAELKVSPATLAQDQYELGILLPYSVVQGDLVRVEKELKDWDEFFKAFFPVIAAKPADVSMRTFSAGNFELSVGLDRETALALGTVIGDIYKMFEQVKANRAKADDLSEQLYPPEIVDRVKAYEQQIVQQDMKAIKEKLVTRFIRREGGRRRETEKHVERGLRFLALRIREGVELELLGPSAADGAGAEKPFRMQTHHVRAAMEMASRGEPAAKPRPERAPQMQLGQIAGEAGKQPEERAA